MKTRGQNRNNKRKKIERFDWFIERIRKGVGFGWLSEGWKNFTPENFLEINRYFDLTSCSNTICQSNNVFPIFLWPENEEAMFYSFHPLADETNNEHLPKPFFKVIRKSRYSRELFPSQRFRLIHVTCAYDLLKRPPSGKTAKYISQQKRSVSFETKFPNSCFNSFEKTASPPCNRPTTSERFTCDIIGHNCS